MTLRLDLPPELESRLSADAAEAGLSLDEYALRLLAAGVAEVGASAWAGSQDGADVPEPVSPPKTPMARELLAMSHEQRALILAVQAEDAGSLYAADLVRPVPERELTALTALDGEPFHQVE